MMELDDASKNGYSDARRVLIVSANESAPWGASETNWALAALEWRARGAEVHISVRGWPEIPSELIRLERAGCRVYRRWEASPFDHRPVFELPWSERVASTLEKVAPDIVVVAQGDNYEGLGWMEECQRREYPFVVYSSSAAEYEWVPDEIASRLRIAYAMAKAAFFVSQRNHELTEWQTGGSILNGRVVRCHYRVPYVVSQPWPEHDKGEVLLACVARLDPASKGHDILFRVLAMQKWRERPLIVSLFGSGRNREVLGRMVESLGLNSVRFMGHVSDVPSIWRSHHGLVLCSRAEGLPAVVVESMLSGRPVIVTDVAGNTEIVRDGITGFVAEAPAVACLDRALERAWQRRSDWPNIGRSAAEVARREIPDNPVTVLVDQWEELTDELSATSRLYPQ